MTNGEPRVERPYVEKVEASVKTGAVAQLGPRTLILGDTGEGKSAIVNAIELAGSGKASDVAGRALVALDAELSTLLPPGGERGFAAIRLSTKEIARWTLERGHKAKRVGPEVSFPLRVVREALLGSPETARKWVLSQARSATWGDVEQLIPEGLHERLRLAAGGGDGPGPGEGGRDPSTDLLLALEGARQRAREATAEARAARAAKGEGLAQPPSDSELQAAADALRLASQSEARTRLEAARPRVAEIERRAAELQEGIAQAARAEEEAAQRVASAERRLAELPPVGSAAQEELTRAAIMVAEHLAHARSTSCVICGQDAKPEAFAARAARARAIVDAQLSAAEEQRATEAVASGARVDMQGAARDAQTWRGELGRIEAERATLRNLLAESDGGPAVGLDYGAAKAAYERLTAARAAWDQLRRAEDRALESDREADEWKRLGEACAQALGTLVERARVAFEERVNRYLPDGDRFGIDLRDGDREVFRFGLRRLGGERIGQRGETPTVSTALHSALSGAEWARVTAALALATAPAEGPCVICPEDRAFSARTLGRVLEAFDRALGDSGLQVIVTSPIEPKTIPIGWTVIRLGGPIEEAQIADGGDPSADRPRRGRPRKVGADKAPAIQAAQEPRAISDTLSSEKLPGPDQQGPQSPDPGAPIQPATAQDTANGAPKSGPVRSLADLLG